MLADRKEIASRFNWVYTRTSTWVKARPRVAVILAVAAMLLLAAQFFFLLIKWDVFGPVPTREALRHIRNPEASVVISVDGRTLGKYFLQNRSEVDLDALPLHLKQALLATEDVRFFDHGGVDYRSLMRVFSKTIILQQESAGGGSTLHQQLAKNLYPRRDFGFLSLPINKAREIVIAQRLNAVFSKSEIMELYLNTVSFGEDVFGIAAASERFFSKRPEDLTPEESATLIGMLKAPTAYNPRLHPEKAKVRRNVVLKQMAKYGFSSNQISDSLSALALNLRYRRGGHHSGLAPYFREVLRQELQERLKNFKRPDGRPYDLYQDGLRIFTTLDSRLQRFAERAVAQNMTRIQKQFDRHWQRQNRVKATGSLLDQAIRRSDRYRHLEKQGLNDDQILEVFRQPVPMRIFSWKGPQSVEMSPADSILHQAFVLQAGFLAMDPLSGAVRAWVGGIDHEFFQYDHVRALRQPGSAFKPLVYATALEQGLSPCDYISNEKTVYSQYDDWAPKNADDSYGGVYSMEGALAQSVNVVAVNLIDSIGPAKVVDLARRIGFSSKMPAVPSLALGTAEVSLLEMVSAYATFVNGGYRTPPSYLLRVETADGKVLFSEAPSGGIERVMSGEAAALVTSMLGSVVDRGTAASLRTRFGLKGAIAGKTGTTQAQADGWFLGATPGLVAGAWVGADDPRVHFRTLDLGQGASTALPIWGSFMKQVQKDEQLSALCKGNFVLPTSELAQKLDCDQFLFPLSMSDFKEWYRRQKAQEEENLP